MKRILKAIYSFLMSPTSDIGPDGAAMREIRRKYPNGFGGGPM